MSEVTAYVGLGSNLSNPVQQVKLAIAELSILPQTRLLAQSSLYRTRPMGPQDQPNYINAVVGLATRLPAEILLSELQRLELSHGRERVLHWGPRTLDLDMLLYGQQVIATEFLQVPHPGLLERSFVVQPLLEIAPDLVLPDGTVLASVRQTQSLLLA